MALPEFVPQDEIRSAFAQAMSRMYREEVPLYGALLDIVDQVNADVLAADPTLADALRRRGEMNRLGQERHGAIRLGTAAELALLRRVFAVMGMVPVGYYDLSVAGVPVHSTAFRPVDPASLRRNPFRLFTSLLRLELIEDEALRREAAAILARRRIVSEEAIALVGRFERDGGLGRNEAERFVAEVLETFRWHSEALVDAETYARLLDGHRLLADIVAFKGPHINHLTPRTLDIDAAQAAMLTQGIEAKAMIEGPPRRSVPILLRQTSFKALEERIAFAGGASGAHSARFGEIEHRGVALTPAGRALYDRLLDSGAGFGGFPDDIETMRREGLAYVSYELVDRTAVPEGAAFDPERLIAAGAVAARSLTYEDFLPVSAAGIFQSNLGAGERRSFSGGAAQARFEQALGTAVIDPFELYRAEEAASLREVRDALGPSRPRG